LQCLQRHLCTFAVDLRRWGGLEKKAAALGINQQRRLGRTADRGKFRASKLGIHHVVPSRNPSHTIRALWGRVIFR